MLSHRIYMDIHILNILMAISYMLSHLTGMLSDITDMLSEMRNMASPKPFCVLYAIFSSIFSRLAEEKHAEDAYKRHSPVR